MRTWWGIAALALGCAPAPRDDSFQNRIAGCATEAECRQVSQEAEARAQRCRTEPECEQARSDAAAADAKLAARIREREESDERAREERNLASQKEREAHDREVAEYAEKRKLQREERERSKQEAADREAAHRRFLGPEGRKKELTGCYEQRPPIECSDTVVKLLAAASDERERRALITLNEKTLQRLFDKTKEPFAGQLLCCDGAVSETCGCGGKLKNCCTKRGGVCGCAARPSPATQATAP